MTRTQVHASGTAIVIDREAGVARWEYPGDTPGSIGKVETYSLSEGWIQKYTTCRICGKPLDDHQLAYALWRFEQGVCSQECVIREHQQRYACCDQAVPRGCVCTASFECPIHGIVCIGSHD